MSTGSSIDGSPAKTRTTSCTPLSRTSSVRPPILLEKFSGYPVDLSAKPRLAHPDLTVSACFRRAKHCETEILGHPG